MRLQALRWLSAADWLDADRARAWRNVLLIMSGLTVVIWCALSRHGVDLTGKPLGSDFASFYAASRLTLSGHPAAAYDVTAHHAAQSALFGGDRGYAAFFYPPLFLLICAPLALLPYLASLAVWLGVTGAAWLAAVRAWLGEGFSLAAAVAFPALLLNLGHGQNAFLSAALLGSGVLWLNPSPVLAGIALGLVAYKPHLGLLIPLMLIAARRWTTMAAAATTVLTMAAASLALFGTGTWRAFLADSALARLTLEQGLVEPGKMVTTFAAARVLGAPVGLAYAAQAAMTLYVAAVVARAAWRHPRAAAVGPLLITATLMASPFLLDYDLAILAFPLAWLAAAGARGGFAPWEKLALAAGFLLPLIARPLALTAHLPIAPLVLLALFQLIARRVDRPAVETKARNVPAEHVPYDID